MSSPVANAASTQALVAQVLSLSRPDRDSCIAVLGPGALDLTLQLCRLGYDEVVCSCRPGSPTCNERSRLVIIGGPVSSQQLMLLLRDATALLGDEGGLVVRLSEIDQDRLVEATLAARGLALASTVFNLAGTPLVCHRVRRLREPEAQLQRVA